MTNEKTWKQTEKQKQNTFPYKKNLNQYNKIMLGSEQ